MAENSASALDELYDCVRQGLSIFELESIFKDFGSCEIAKRQYLYEIRFSKDPCKKLMDEIMPVARFSRLGNISTGFVRFPLDYQIPDCFLRREDDVEHHKIEVTVAQGKARFHVTKYLEENGSSSGVIREQDDSRADFTGGIIDNQEKMYETDEVLEAVREAIKIAKTRSYAAALSVLAVAEWLYLDWPPARRSRCPTTSCMPSGSRCTIRVSQLRRFPACGVGPDRPRRSEGCSSPSVWSPARVSVRRKPQSRLHVS
jgi:hypothetical protein